jgi:chloride channel protein, CIC family
MTDDYRVILPAMLATVLSIVVTRALVGESIYTLKLRRQNIPYYAGVELERLHAAAVTEAMRADLPPLAAHTTIMEALSLAVRHRAQALAVVDAQGGLAGVVTLEQLSAAAAADVTPLSVSAVMTSGPEARVEPGERLETVLARLSESDTDALAVVAPDDGRVLGIVSRRDLMRVYERVLRRG